MAVFKPRPTKLARKLSNNATEAERQLWRRLSNRQLGGYKFSRQMPIAGFICDFVCREARLIVEADGGQHDLEADADAVRTRLLEDWGFRVRRFWNNEVLGNIEGVLQTILSTITECPPPPLLLAGGEIAASVSS